MSNQQNPNGYSETFSGTNSKMLTASFLIVILVGAMGLYFAMKPKMISSQIEKSLPEKEAAAPITGNVANPQEPLPMLNNNITREGVVIQFDDVRICSYFDEDMCVENFNKQIKRGETFYVYEEIISNNPYTRTQVFEQSLKIEDEDGNVIFEKKEFDEFLVGRGENVTIPVKVRLYTFENDPVRKEIATFTFQNKYTHEKIEKQVIYELI